MTPAMHRLFHIISLDSIIVITLLGSVLFFTFSSPSGKHVVHSWPFLLAHEIKRSNIINKQIS